MDRREHTSAEIRAATIAEFSQTGHRSLSLRNVAKRAYVSVGAVYERWPNKDACIDDLVTQDLPEIVQALRDHWQRENATCDDLVAQGLLDTPIVQRLRFVAECVFAARDKETLRPVVSTAITDIANAVLAKSPSLGSLPGMGWWITSTWLGYAVLKPSGCPIPDSFVREVSSIVDQLGHDTAEPLLVTSLTSNTVEFLPERPIPKDATTDALLRATQHVIEQHGVSGADVRTIAEAAGVTTGALYRRFRGRSDLLATTFFVNLPPERYAWTQPLLASLQANGVNGGASLLTALCERIWKDEAGADALLELSIAAHTDPDLRNVITTEIQRVAENRAVFIAALQMNGIVRADVSPEATAWLFQVPPVGMRLLASIGIVPNSTDLTQLFGAYLRYLLVAPSPDDDSEASLSKWVLSDP